MVAISVHSAEKSVSLTSTTCKKIQYTTVIFRQSTVPQAVQNVFVIPFALRAIAPTSEGEKNTDVKWVVSLIEM